MLIMIAEVSYHMIVNISTDIDSDVCGIDKICKIQDKLLSVVL